MTVARLSAAEEAIRHVRTGDTVMVGGFGLVGAPLTLLDALVERSDATDLTIISNNIGEPGKGLGHAAAAGPDPPRDLLVLHVEPRGRGRRQRRRDRGDAARRRARSRRRSARAGPASPASSRPWGPGTLLAEGKEERVIDGVPHVLEPAIRADVSLVFAARADTLGNLWYRRTARNFNPLMATAARVTIAEAGEVVPVGGIEAESVMTPHLYIDELVVQA